MKRVTDATERRYRKILSKYRKLKKKYSKISRKKTNMIALIFTAVIAFIGLAYYREPVIVETGAILFTIGMVVELGGTKRKEWIYTDSLYMIAGRVPIEIAVQYFLIGMIAASYYFFRIYGFTLFL